MVVFLYSDEKFEAQAILCIKSLLPRVEEGTKVVYYTVGFESGFECRGLEKHRVEFKRKFPDFYYYKSDLSLLTMDKYPGEFYVFTDIDVLFSRNFSLDKVFHHESYPLASYGPHEYPFIWKKLGDTLLRFDEQKLMTYLNVPVRTQRYVWSCLFSFGSECRDFLEEYTSICNNEYLLKRREDYMPYADESAFNVCLWKRSATKNLGFGFVNTHLLSTVEPVEENKVNEHYFNNAVDAFGSDWEYVKDSSKILFYHGFKDKTEMSRTVDYLVKS